MPWAVVPITGLFLLFGFWIVSKIDQWLQKDVLPINLVSDPSNHLLLHLDPERVLPDQKEQPDELQITLLYGNHLYLEDIPSFFGLLAFSSNDLDNLMIIRAVLHRKNDCVIAARCNDSLFYDLYQQAGAHVVFSEDTSLGDAIHHMKGRHF